MFKEKNLNIYIFFFFVIFSITLELYGKNSLDTSSLLSNPYIPNYTLIEQKDLGEHKRVFWFRHDKTKADIVFTQDLDGVNNLLSISIRTLPFDDSGVFHIIEHSVLESSQKYDVHNLFSKLKISNIVTEMGAATFMDRTHYVVASYNDQSFINLSNAYIDCVFSPNIEKYPEIFYREGIRRELSSDNFLSYNGVVFNEVSNNLGFSKVLSKQYRKVLLEGSGYEYESGGDIVAMTDLVYEDFLNTYRKYYHPSNALIYFYGNSSLDIEERLRYLDENYLSRYDYNPEFEQDRKVQQPRFVPDHSIIHRASYYTSDESYTEEKNSSIILGYRMDRTDLEYVTILNLIMDLLFNDEASRYRQTLLESGLFGDIEARVHVTGKYSIVVISVEDTDSENTDLIKTKIQEIFDSVFKSDLSYDKKVLDSLVSQRMFLQEKAKSDVSIGASDYDKIEQGWINDGNPLSGLDIDEILKRLHSVLKGSNSKFKSSVFYQVLEEGFLQNQNYYIGVLSPNSELMDERNEDLYSKLVQEEMELTDDKKAEIKNISKSIREQETLSYDESGNSIINIDDNLPSIPIQSIIRSSNRAYTPVSVEEDVDGIKFLEFDSKEDINHIEMFWGLSHLKRGEIKILSFIVDIISSISTGNMDALEINEKLNFLGNIDAEFRMLPTEYGRVIPTLAFSFDYLNQNQDEMFSLVHDILFNTTFKDKERIKHLISVIYAVRKNYSFLNDISRNLDDEARYNALISLLRSVYKKVFLNGSCVIGIRAKKERFDDIKSGISRYFDKKYDPLFFKAIVDSGMDFSSSESSGVRSRNNTMSMSEDSTGYLSFESPIDIRLSGTGGRDVIFQFLNSYYLSPRIRNEGGAYGLNLTISDEGLLSFSSSLDPDAQSTLRIVQDIPDFLISVMGMDEKDLEKIADTMRIATVSKLDIPENVSDVASRSFSRFFTGETDEDIQRRREEMVNFSFKKDLGDCIAFFSESIKEGKYEGSMSNGSSNENDRVFVK